MSPSPAGLRQRTDEWRRLRLGRITGTRFAAAVAGRHTRTHRDLIDELVEERRTGRWRQLPMNEWMRWGVAHEPAARDWYRARTGAAVAEPAFVVHPELDFVGVSPDGCVGEEGLLEIKCPQQRGHAETKGRRAPPPRYRWQVQGQLWVCGRRWLDYVSFLPPDDGVVLRVLPDPADFARLRERCLEVEAEVRRRLA